jgi:UPF0271 protein
MINLPELNCDLGEGIACEADIFPWIDAASVACGGHTGDEVSLTETLGLAKKLNKKVGAHPSYPDQENFGRVSIEINDDSLINSIYSQIQLFERIAERVGIPMSHIKFHGALYNDSSSNPDLAGKLVDFLKNQYPTIPLFTPPTSILHHLAVEKGLSCKLELFGDRVYQDNYQLLPRLLPNALLIGKNEVSSQISDILEKGYIITSTNNKLKVKADTICLHGDNPKIMDFLPSIRKHYWS